MASARSWWVLAARLTGTAAGIAYVVHAIDLHDVGDAFGRLSIGALAAATVLVGLNVVAGAERWRQLLRAYAAVEIPALARATSLYYVSFFYNNYLPGAVTGDVLRGVVTRDVFGERGATAGLAIVFVERALGLFGVFLLLAIGLLAAGGALDTRGLWIWSAAGIAGSVALVALLPFARRLAPHLPDRLAVLARRVPAVEKWPAFVLAVALSVLTQLLVAVAGWVLLRAIDPAVGLGESLLIVPLAAATTFLPITVGGAGAREAVYVSLGASLLHMVPGDAAAASLGLWLAHLVNGAIGGVIQLRRRA